jgi:hypothetical protein
LQWRGLRPRQWLLEFEPAAPRVVEPLMGWTSSSDPFAQIRLTFPSHSAAVAYAERYGLDYEVDEPVRRRSRPQLKKATLNNGDVAW